MRGMGDLKLIGFVLHIAVLFHSVMNFSDHINGPDCGISKPAHDSILQAKKAHKTQIPWKVIMLVQYRWNETDQTFRVCCGTIISQRYILTAAHCLRYRSAMPLFGVVYYNLTSPTSGSIVWIEDFILHPKFESTSMRNDVALVRVESPLRFDEYIRPICLPTKMMHLAGKPAVVSGWSDTEESTRILPFEKCKGRLHLPRPEEFLNKKNTICISNLGKGRCQRVPGGRVTVKSSRGRTIQVGIVSDDQGCGKRDDPTMYTRVDYHVRWIKEQIRNPRPPRWHVPTVEDAMNNSASMFNMYREDALQ